MESEATDHQQMGSKSGEQSTPMDTDDEPMNSAEAAHGIVSFSILCENWSH